MPRGYAHGHAIPQSVAHQQQARTRGNKHAKPTAEYSEAEPATQCPLCCEDLDQTEKEFRPCPCGYQVCLFCLSRLRDEYGNRCPGCRTLYGTDPEEWARQSEARAREAEANRVQHWPQRSQTSSPANGTASSRQGLSAPRAADDDEQPKRRQPIVKPASPSPSSTRGDAGDDKQHWPSLAQNKRSEGKQAPAPAPTHRRNSSTHNSTNPAAPASHQSSDQQRDTRHTSQSGSSEPSAVAVPVTVQSVINGQATTINTTLQLRPPCPRELQHFVPADGNAERLLSQFQQLASGAGGARNAPNGRPPASAAKSQPRSIAPSQPLSTGTASGPASAGSIPFPPPGISAVPSARGSNGLTHYEDWSTKSPASLSSPSKQQAPLITDSVASGDGTSAADPGSATYHPLRGAPVFGSALHEAAASSHDDDSFAADPFGTPANATLTSQQAGRVPAATPSPSSASASKPNLLPQLFSSSAAPTPGRASPAGWLTEPACDSNDLWNINKPLASLLPVDPKSYAARRVPLYERGNPEASPSLGSRRGSSAAPERRASGAVSAAGASPPGVDTASQDPVIDPRQLAAKARPIGGGVNHSGR